MSDTPQNQDPPAHARLAATRSLRSGARPPRELANIQRWMQTVITHPEGIVSGIDSAAARSGIDVSLDEVETLINRSRSQTSLERLAVYGGAYFARLLGVLRDEFPALRHAVGEEAFDGFAFGYLRACPSQSYTLADLSADFPRYLAETRPAAQDETGEPDWVDFLIDLALLERTYSEVFNCPGPERGRHLKAEDLRAVPAENYADARLVPVECLRLLTLRFPVHEYASAVRRGEEPTVPDPQATWLVVSRRDFIVRRLAVSRVQYELLRAIAEGEPLGEAIARAVAETDADVDELAGQLQQWFTGWAAAQFFSAVQLPDSGRG